ncbi:12734_t:CDS:2 [Gigaspora margarita]|uniref:12734_t:CDS:1 n=1 Tax=Gigaspora margarita TaxID=4874 RepID=A0ABN7UB33_GIGMA|nr:12734_t:CDS:2 [Gigaspora margarita]
MRAKVDKLVEQEMRKRPSQSKRDYASHFPSNFELFKESPILGTEYQRVQQGKPITEMDTSRYKLIEPDDKEDEESWKKAVDNSNAQLYHQNHRFFNLELLQKFGANAWKLHNYQLEHELQQLQRTLEDYPGSQIEALENKWTELIGQTLQLEQNFSTVKEKITQIMTCRAIIVESFKNEEELEEAMTIKFLNKNEKELEEAVTIKSLKKYECKPEEAEKFLNIIGSNFKWSVSMPDHYRHHVFWALTDDVGRFENDDKVAYNYLVFFNCLDKDKFEMHMNKWVLVYWQKVIEYGQEFTEEQWSKLDEEKPGAIYLPADLSKHPNAKPAR